TPPHLSAILPGKDTTPMRESWPNEPGTAGLPLNGHADLFQELFALLLEQVREVGQRLPFGERLGQRRYQAGEGIQGGEAVRRAAAGGPVGDADDAVGRVLAEAPFRDDMLKTPRPDLDPVFQANLQERPQSRLQLARGPGQGTFGFELATGRPELLLPQVAEG